MHKNQQKLEKAMCYSIPSTEIIFILRYLHITTELKEYLTCKYDILQTGNRKFARINMATIVKIGFSFAMQLAYPVIIEISSQQGSLTQQPYELL